MTLFMISPYCDTSCVKLIFEKNRNTLLHVCTDYSISSDLIINDSVIKLICIVIYSIMNIQYYEYNNYFLFRIKYRRRRINIPMNWTQSSPC